MASSNFKFGGFKQNANDRKTEQIKTSNEYFEVDLNKTDTKRTFYASISIFSQPSAGKYVRRAGKAFKIELP